MTIRVQRSECRPKRSVQVFGGQARTCAEAGVAMHPRARAGSVERFKALRKQAADHAGKDVA